MPTAAETLAQKLAQEMLGWKSITLSVRTNWDGHPDTEYILEDYIETASGQRYDEIKAFQSKPRDMREIAWCDGKHCAYLAYGGVKGEDQGTGVPLYQRNAILSDIFMHEKEWGCTNRPQPLQLFYVNWVPLHQALSKAIPQGEGSCLGRPCEVFLFPQTLWGFVKQDLVYYLDRATGVPLQFKHYTNAKLREQGQPNGEWRALTLDEVHGFHMPFKSKYVIYQPNKKNVLCKVQTDLVAVEVLKYDVAYPKTTFWPAPFEAGVEVSDFLVKPWKFYKVLPGGGEGPSTLGVEPTAAVPAPVRAAAPSGWSGPLAWGAFLLGVSLLAVVLVQKLRRR